MLDLLRERHYRVSCDFSRRLVVLVRSTLPFESLEALAQCFDKIERSLATVDRSRFVMLVDTRAVTARTDPEFESAFEQHRKRLVTPFCRVAIVVQTVGGRLQVKRHATIDRLGTRAFEDEAEALEYLMEALAEQSQRPPGSRA